MATSNKTITEIAEDTNSQFMSHMTALRASIQQNYAALIDAIRQRESQLLQELAAIEQKHRQEYEKCQKAIDELQESRNHTLNSISAEDMMDFRDSMVKKFDEQIKLVRMKIDTKTVSFDWDTLLAERVTKIGSIKCQSSSQQPTTLSINYRNKVYPTIKTCMYKKYQKNIDDLQESRKHTLNSISGEDMMDFRDIIVKQIDNKIKLVKMKIDKQAVTFEWDTQLADGASEIGSVKYQSSSQPTTLSIDYKKKIDPAIKTCKQGTAPGELNQAWGVASDSNTNNIYVVDHSTSRVCAFSSEGEFLFQFNGNTNNTIKMSYPIGIAIHENKVFVSQHGTHCIQVYTLDGTYIQQFGGRGVGKDQLNSPRGVAISSFNGDIFVCEWSNNRVQIFSRYWKHKSFLGLNQLQGPRDVKLSQQEIFVLENNSLCVYIYDYNTNYLRSIINRKGNGYTINNAHCMFVDTNNNNNIILSDYDTHCVLVFSYIGDIIHQIGNTAKMFTNPKGVLIDSLGRLIIVSRKIDACIHIF